LKFGLHRHAATGGGRSRRERSLDEHRRAGDDARGRFDAGRTRDRGGRRELESLERDAEATAPRQLFLDWAVPRLSPKRLR